MKKNYPTNLESLISFECLSIKLPKSNVKISVLRLFEKNSLTDSSNHIDDYIYLLINKVFELNRGRAFVLDLEFYKHSEEIDFPYVLTNQLKRKHPCCVVGSIVDRSIHKGIVFRESLMEAVNKDIALVLKKYTNGSRINIDKNYLKENTKTINIESIGIDHSVLEWGGNGGLGVTLSLSGNYEFGSSGKLNAMAIKWILRDVCVLLKPDMLIVDVRKLNYEWGDDLNLYPAQFMEKESLIRIIVCDNESIKYGLNECHIADNINSAKLELEYLFRKRT